jgi:hypothetical protein
MAEDSQSNPSPNINIINIASDDTMWVLETDHSELLRILADPAAWVLAHVRIGDTPAILWQPFVVVFHEVGSIAEKPTIHVHGIHETSVVTVKYSRSKEAAPSTDGLFPEGAVVALLQTGERVYTHLEMREFTKAEVANTLFVAVTHPEVYLRALNALPQTLNGTDTPPAQKKVFGMKDGRAPHVTFQGWTPKEGLLTASEAPTQPVPADACNVGSGDADANGNVWLHGIIVKSYAPPV